MVAVAVVLQILGVVAGCAGLWLLFGPASALILVGAVTFAAGIELERREP